MSVTNLTSLYVEDTLNFGTALQVGGVELLNTSVDALVKVAKVTLGITTGAGGLLSWVNPESTPIIVTRLVVDVTTSASGVTTADFGPATGGDQTGDTLIDGIDIGTAAILGDNIDDAGTSGLSKVKVPISEYLVGAASADPASVVGTAYIYYLVT